MTQPEPTTDDNITLVEVRLQILAFLMGDGFSYLVKTDHATFGDAAKQVTEAAKVLENYILDIVEEPDSSN